MDHGFRRELRALDEQNELLVIGLIMESPSARRCSLLQALLYHQQQFAEH